MGSPSDKFTTVKLSATVSLAPSGQIYWIGSGSEKSRLLRTTAVNEQADLAFMLRLIKHTGSEKCLFCIDDSFNGEKQASPIYCEV